MYTFIVLINLFYHRYLKYLITVSFYAFTHFLNVFVFLIVVIMSYLLLKISNHLNSLHLGRIFSPMGGGGDYSLNT